MLRLLYDLVLHLNLNLRILNKLSMITIITLFHLLKALSLFLSMNYMQVFFDKPLVGESEIFSFDFTWSMRIISFERKYLMILCL
jgi:hypothetical protein